ncbi:short-chain dehydrogenase [Clostridium sp. E02]|uniref:short-chain dehydrogenase n=1 Tax=Clostridium sp. E02 TaxID=2487134 RepID=UPI000F525D9D|nr:short-chain dehydrogenase [Clostridium sp. E02]
MTKQVRRQNASMGSPTLILIFIILCLVTFGLLSLFTAKSEWDLAKKNAAAVKEYYRADGLGEKFYKEVLGKEREIREKGMDLDTRKKWLTEGFGTFYDPKTDTVTAKIDMKQSQALIIGLQLNKGRDPMIDIYRWEVIQTEDYEIDQSMPVWSGEKQTAGE